VILDRPVQLGTYGQLPTLHYLDRFKGKEKAQLFESVGYGVETSTPKTETGGDTRRISIQKIVNFNGVHGMGPNVALLFTQGRRRIVGFVVLAYGAYFVFHAVYQESLTLRYALPLGTFLGAAGTLVVFLGDALLAWYRGLFGG